MEACAIAVLLYFSATMFAYADNEHIKQLQKNASTAYEKMMETKQNADTLAKDAAFAERKVTSIKQKLTAAEQDYATAKTKAEQARAAFEKATQQWNAASGVLATEWNNNQ